MDKKLKAQAIKNNLPKAEMASYKFGTMVRRRPAKVTGYCKGGKVKM